MLKILPSILLFIVTSSVCASEIVFDFNSPAFNGNGYSSHILTIEQLESNRKRQIEEDKQAVIDRAERDIKSTNAYKFRNNLESRIYATLSKQIADSMFNEGTVWTELTEYAVGTVVTYNNKTYKSTVNANVTTPGSDSSWVLTDSDWATSETPFGDVVSWKRENDRIYVEVKDSNGDTIAEFDVPVGEFSF